MDYSSRADGGNPQKMDKTCRDREKMYRRDSMAAGDRTEGRLFPLPDVQRRRREMAARLHGRRAYRDCAPHHLSAAQGRPSAALPVGCRRPNTDRIPDHLHHQGPGNIRIQPAGPTSWFPARSCSSSPACRHFYKPEYEVGLDRVLGRIQGTLRGHLCASRVSFPPKKPLYEVGLQNSLLAIYTQIFELVQNQRPSTRCRASSHVLTLIAEILAHERKNGAVHATPSSSWRGPSS